MKKILIACIIALFAFPAFALELSEAKSSGLVGERTDGYLGIVTPTPTPDVKVLVNDINAKRRAKYQQVSRENGQPLSVVEKIAGQKAIAEHVAVDEYYMNNNGAWVKK